MGRHLEFDRQSVLDAAMQVLWTQGYGNTSMIDLERATGLQPGSIYNAFGSKKGLFLHVIDHYIANVVELRIESILQRGAPLSAIENFFRSAFEDVEPSLLIGCLLTNTATEFGHDDADIQSRISSGFNRMEQAFKQRLDEACSIGELDTQKDTTLLATHLVATFQGLCVMGRALRDKDRLHAITDAALLPLQPGA